ncbi:MULTISPECIES: BID domain-containing T4SS effector [Bartonella]|uniref:BID domain-containing T4SS effector n=1 Tax=Bartonella TaxID=773 RepID=UPI00235E8BC3|nr:MULTISPECIES: BID domain-containing T4SS effector [Bartonella]
MKKRNPSPFITEMMEKFQQQTEQSPTRTSPPQVSQSVSPPPVQTRRENLSSPPKVAPPPPQRIREKTQTNTISPSAKIQETPSLQTNMAPPNPPRMRERQQHSTQVQTSPSLQTKVAPPPPPRVRDKTPTDTKIQKPETQESPSTHIKTAPQRPPRAKDREQNRQAAQESPSLQTKVAPPPPPRMRDRAQTSTKIQNPEIQESPSTHIKTAPQRPPRAKDREQNRQAAQESPSLQTKVAPALPPRMRDKVQTSTKIQNSETLAPSVRPKTPRHRQVRQQSSSSSQDSEIYAVPRSRKPHQIGDRQKSDAFVQKMASPQTAIKQPKPSQEHKTSINTMERELLLVAYQEEIRFLCKKAFGDRLILEQRIEAVKENPNMGEQLLWDITENPQTISKLAGRKVLGIKNGARKKAEEALSSLCTAIEGFMYTSKYTKTENISQSPHTKQRQHRQAQQEEAITQTQNPLKSEKKIEPLSNQEIARRIQQDPSVKYGQREIEYWCQIVYNDPFILQYRMEDMHKIPDMGEELVFQIEKDSTSFAPLAGRKTLGIKNGARKAAEESLPTLCTAIKDYADTIKQLRETIVQNHQTEQQQRHQPLSDLDKNQQSLSQSPKFPERSTAKRHQELTETSKQEERPPMRPRRAETSKTMALS